VIFPTGPVRVMVAVQPVDFRKGIDGLAAIVKEELGTDPYSGVVYVFRARRGVVLISKRPGGRQVPVGLGSRQG
jgi:transposase